MFTVRHIIPASGLANLLKEDKGGELFTCSEGGDGESAEEGSGVVTIGAAFRAPQSMYVLIQNQGKTLTRSALRRCPRDVPTWVAQSGDCREDASGA